MAVSARRARTTPRKEVLEYLEVPLRRPLLVIIPWILVLAAALASTYVLPKKYKSSTLILVESGKVPESFVPQLATERTARRLQSVKQEVLSRTRLERIVQEANPYGTNGTEPITAIVERMRDHIEVAVKENDAFSIEFINSDPHKAQLVANRLATLFIDETSASRQKQVREGYAFIDEQLEGARRELEGREQTLRRYKEQHMGTLPEQMGANLATLQRLQLELQTVSESLRAANDRLALYQRQPETTDDSRGSEAARLREQLTSLRARYTEEHPDIIALRQQLARVQTEPRGGAARDAVDGGAARTSDTIERAEQEVRGLEARREELQRKLGQLQGRVDSAPRTEQEIATLTRDFQKLNENYLALLNKKLDAQMATKLEETWKGEQFRILDPANYPERPFFPNRYLFLVLGAVLGLALGLGMAFADDYLDHSVRDAADAEALFAYPVLATLPLIGNEVPARRTLKHE